MKKLTNTDFIRRSDCPISFTLDIFGDKWSLLILRDILLYNRTHFRDFTPQEHIATNILSDRLMKLESIGIIAKQKDHKHKNQYIYTATPKGEALLPLLTEMTLWGLEYDPQSLASKHFIERTQSEKQKVVREINRAIRFGKFIKYRSESMGINP
jgi:DNA-binding HxlR family transcriptional regulator